MEVRVRQWAMACGLCFVPLAASAGELKFNTQDFPPFSYLANGQVAGPAVEVVKAVCKEARLECRFELLPWIRAQKEIEAGEAHGLFLIGWSEERAKQLHFSPPVVASAYGVFAHADDPLRYLKPADLAGYTVGVFGPSATSRSLERLRDQVVAQKLKPVVIEMRPDDESGFQKLEGKRVQAVYSNQHVGEAMVAKLGLKQVRYVGAAEPVRYHIGLSRKAVDAASAERFDQAFRKLHHEGVIGKLLAAHRMQDVPRKAWDEK